MMMMMMMMVMIMIIIISPIHTFFLNEWFRTTAVQEATCGWGRLPHAFEWADQYVFDILQIPSGCNRICRRCIAPSCTHLAMGMVKVYQLDSRST